MLFLKLICSLVLLRSYIYLKVFLLFVLLRSFKHVVLLFGLLHQLLPSVASIEQDVLLFGFVHYVRSWVASIEHVELLFDTLHSFYSLMDDVNYWWDVGVRWIHSLIHSAVNFDGVINVCIATIYLPRWYSTFIPMLWSQGYTETSYSF